MDRAQIESKLGSVLATLEGRLVPGLPAPVAMRLAAAQVDGLLKVLQSEDEARRLDPVSP